MYRILIPQHLRQLLALEAADGLRKDQQSLVRYMLLGNSPRVLPTQVPMRPFDWEWLSSVAALRLHDYWNTNEYGSSILFWILQCILLYSLNDRSHRNSESLAR